MPTRIHCHVALESRESRLALGGALAEVVALDGPGGQGCFALYRSLPVLGDVKASAQTPGIQLLQNHDLKFWRQVCDVVDLAENARYQVGLRPQGLGTDVLARTRANPPDRRAYLEASMLRRLLLHDGCTLLVDGQRQSRLLIVTKHLSETQVALWRGRVSVTVPDGAGDGKGRIPWSHGGRSVSSSGRS